jgi:hypothetical protein
MTMADYLAETESAIALLIDGIQREQAALEQRARGLIQQRPHGVVVAAGEGIPPGLLASWFLDEDADEPWLLPPGSWAAYFGSQAMQLHNDMVAAVQAAEAGHFSSLDALAGALVQVAAQGWTIVHGNEPPPPGRDIKTQTLSHVIREARNQAMHWDVRIDQHVRDCFGVLARDYENPAFKDVTKRSLAFEVVNLLEWRDAAAFKEDLQSLS